MRRRRTNIWIGSSLNITVWSPRRSRSGFPIRPQGRLRNRKPLEEPAALGATWELRFGPKNSFRVFYDVNNEEKIVSVLAIGVKEGNQLFIGGQEFEL